MCIRDRAGLDPDSCLSRELHWRPGEGRGGPNKVHVEITLATQSISRVSVREGRSLSVFTCAEGGKASRDAVVVSSFDPFAGSLLFFISSSGSRRRQNFQPIPSRVGGFSIRFWPPSVGHLHKYSHRQFIYGYPYSL